jgi:hypothetical protein
LQHSLSLPPYSRHQAAIECSFDDAGGNTHINYEPCLAGGLQEAPKPAKDYHRRVEGHLGRYQTSGSKAPWRATPAKSGGCPCRTVVAGLMSSIIMRRTIEMKADSGNAPQATNKVPDEETIEYAQKIFHLVRIGDAETLGPLLAKGLPANLCNHKGDSLLMLASYHGHADAARALLEHGADPEMRNDHGQTPIAGAAYKGDLAMVRLLLEHGADVEGAAPDGKTALMLAAMFNRTEVVDLLLAHGANIDARDAGGLTALAAAQAMGAQDTAAQLARLSH